LELSLLLILLYLAKQVDADEIVAGCTRLKAVPMGEAA